MLPTLKSDYIIWLHLEKGFQFQRTEDKMTFSLKVWILAGAKVDESPNLCLCCVSKVWCCVGLETKLLREMREEDWQVENWENGGASQLSMVPTRCVRDAQQRDVSLCCSMLTTVGKVGAWLLPFRLQSLRPPRRQWLIEMEIQEVLLQREEVSHSAR